MHRSTAAVMGTIVGVTMLVGLKVMPPPTVGAHDHSDPQDHRPPAVAPSVQVTGGPPESPSPRPSGSADHGHDDGDGHTDDGHEH